MKLKSLKISNFKSFSKASVHFAGTLSAIVGPNGSGKSNISDAIKFCLGEKRLKSLRAKKVGELINSKAHTASVMLSLGDEEKTYEIKRAVRKDGKIKYEINGKNVKLNALKDFLRRHGIKGIDTFVIPQGQVTKIALLNPKERRVFLDEISGIAEFEEKKKEAMGELNIVEQRIKEANVLIGEKARYLDELKKEKEQAELYEEKRVSLANVRGTLLDRKVFDLEKKVSSLTGSKNELLNFVEQKKAELSKIQGEIESIYKDRQGLDLEIEAKTKRSELYKKMEKLKTDKAVYDEKLRAKSEKITLLREELANAEKELDAIDAKESALEEELKKLKKELESMKDLKEEKLERKSISMKVEVDMKKQKLAGLETNIAKLQEKLNGLKKLVETKKEIASNYDVDGDSRQNLADDLEKAQREISLSFEKEKSFNNRIAEHDKNIIRTREKLATLRASVGTEKVSPVHVFLTDLASSEQVKGLYGRVIDLINFDEKYSEAVDAAGGARLSFYVVENLETARKAISFLKKMNIGRASFIPMQEIYVEKSQIGNNLLLSTVINGDEKFSKIIDFVFSNTVLVETFDKAKPLIGKQRVVTLDGELFEKSAVVTGGKGKGSLAAKKAIEQLETELESITEERKSAIAELANFRESLSNLRARKTFLEKKIEEQKANEQKSKNLETRAREASSFVETAEKEILSAEQELQQNTVEREKILSELNLKEAKLKAQEEEEQTLFGQKLSEKEESLKIKISTQERAKGLESEKLLIKSARTKEFHNVSKTKEEINREESESKKIEDESRILSSELMQMQDDFERKEDEIRELMKKSRGIEEKLRDLAKKESSERDAFSKSDKELNKIEIELATHSTKLEDLKIEFSRIGEFTKLDKEEETLQHELESLEKELGSLGNINFAAKELYFRVYDEVGEVKEKLDKLKSEKDKIIELMYEIDQRKKTAFFTHFEQVNKNYSTLFSNISGFGEGSIYLDKPNEPFNSGLYMRLVRDNKQISMESLSGGEQTIMSLLFIFALQATKPSPIYILDEIDAALDKLNSQRMAELIKNLSAKTQFLVITHNEIMMNAAEIVIGVSKEAGFSKVIHMKANRNTSTDVKNAMKEVESPKNQNV